MTLNLKEEKDEERGSVANWVLHVPPSHSIPRALQCCAACILLQNSGQLASIASHINKQRSCSHTHVIAIHVTKKKHTSGIIAVRQSHGQLPTRISSFPLNRKNSSANLELNIFLTVMYVIRLHGDCVIIGSRV